MKVYLGNKEVTNFYEEKLEGICKYVQEHLKFLILEVGDESEAYLVFDTTNTRGLRLSPSEALKGRLAVIAREDGNLSKQLIAKWNNAASKLESAGLSIDSMDDYLYAVWISRHDDNITKRTLGQVSFKLATIERVREFVEAIEAYYDSYLAVVRPTDKSWLAEDLKDLNQLNIQSRPLLMMVHKHFRGRFEEAVNIVFSLQIRNITVGNGQPHDYEKLWPKWARQVFHGQIDDAFFDMRAQIVSDDKFQESFEVFETHSVAIARHLLRRLDPVSHKSSGVIPLKVDVEHILPKGVVRKLLSGKKITRNVGQWLIDMDFDIPATPSEMTDLGNKLQRYLNALGNMALFDAGTNRGARDSSFKDKQFGKKAKKPNDKDIVGYKNQVLELTKSLADIEKWDTAAIGERQKKMAKKAPQVWPK